MKLFYATSLVYPSGLANRVQIFAMAKEFARQLGSNFLLGVRSVEGLKVPSTPEGLDADFPIINFHSQSSYVLAWKMLRCIKSNAIDVVYGRERALLFFLWFYNTIFFRCPLRFFYEVHEFPDGRLLAIMFEWALAWFISGYIFVTRGLGELYKKRYPRIYQSIVAPDGVDLSIFDIQISRDDARRKLGLPLDKFIIGYCGRFRTMGMEKGLLDVLAALPYFPKEVIFVAMGGKPRDVFYYQERATALGLGGRALFIEHFHQGIVALYQKSADVLLMPFPYTQHYAYYMSPLKMFEYMASQRPIITTDLPSVREVLNETSAVFVPPGDPRALAEATQCLLHDSELGVQLATQARKDIEQYTWRSRTQKILNFLA